MIIFLSIVPYRQANLVQVERVHKGSAQQPRSLETIFVFNESLSDQADMSWNIQSTTQTRFVMIVLIGRVTQSNTFTEFLIWKIMGIFAKRWLPSVIDRKNIKHDIEVANDVSRHPFGDVSYCKQQAALRSQGPLKPAARPEVQTPTEQSNSWDVKHVQPALQSARTRARTFRPVGLSAKSKNKKREKRRKIIKWKQKQEIASLGQEEQAASILRRRRIQRRWLHLLTCLKQKSQQQQWRHACNLFA